MQGNSPAKHAVMLPQNPSSFAVLADTAGLFVALSESRRLGPREVGSCESVRLRPRAMSGEAESEPFADRPEYILLNRGRPDCEVINGVRSVKGDRALARDS